MVNVRIEHIPELARARNAIARAVQRGDAEGEATARRAYKIMRGETLIQAGRELLAYAESEDR